MPYPNCLAMMPVPNKYKNGPIIVLEENDEFLVKIDFRDKERAKSIPGRQWDGKRKAWIYSRTTAAYDALVEEFSSDADQFTIRRPKTSRPPPVRPPNDEDDAEDWSVAGLDEIEQGQQSLRAEIASLHSAVVGMQELAVTNGKALKKLIEQSSEAQQSNPTNAERSEPQELPSSPDLLNDSHLDFLEEALRQMAVKAAEDRDSFIRWVYRYEPVRSPHRFIVESHEFLADQLRQLLGATDKRDSFKALINEAKEQELIYSDPSSPVNVHHTLNAMNINRNRVVHGREKVPQEELWSRAVSYLMQISLVWPYVVVTDGDDST